MGTGLRDAVFDLLECVESEAADLPGLHRGRWRVERGCVASGFCVISGCHGVIAHDPILAGRAIGASKTDFVGYDTREASSRMIVWS